MKITDSRISRDRVDGSKGKAGVTRRISSLFVTIFYPLGLSVMRNMFCLCCSIW
jgi:hypothetical protein